LKQTHSTRFQQALDQVRHFADLTPSTKNALADVAVLRHFPAGQVIYLEGEPAQTLYILESGWVKATRISPEGREQALLFLRGGEVFGDVAVYTGAPYPGTVTALEPVEAWAVDQASMLGLIARYPDLAMAVIRRLSERVMYYVGLVEDLTLHSVESRLASTLLKHAESDGYRLIVPRRAWTTFDEMAVRLGTVRDVLARALHSLEQEGLLRVEKHAIVILDPQGLILRGNS
jgi:CRP/FNR family transcriptional regulator